MFILSTRELKEQMTPEVALIVKCDNPKTGYGKCDCQAGMRTNDKVALLSTCGTSNIKILE